MGGIALLPFDDYFISLCPACSWSEMMSNSLTYGGKVNPATTVEACQAACAANSSCSGIDWDTKKSSGEQCYLSGPWITSWNIGQAPGVNHYNYTCAGTGNNATTNLSFYARQIAAVMLI